MENPIKMDDLGGKPLFWKHPYQALEIFFKLIPETVAKIPQGI